MIEVLIKSVYPFSEYEGLIYSYKINCLLSNGREITFIDDKPFDLTELINKTVLIELATSFLSKSQECSYIFEGIIELSDLSGKYHFVSNELIVLIAKEIIELEGFNPNEREEYCFEEFTLINWGNVPVVGRG